MIELTTLRPNSASTVLDPKTPISTVTKFAMDFIVGRAINKPQLVPEVGIDVKRYAAVVSQLDPNDALLKLADVIEWWRFDEAFSQYYSEDKGPPGYSHPAVGGSVDVEGV